MNQIVINFKDVPSGIEGESFAEYESHTGEIVGWELDEALMNDRSFIEDKIVYVFYDSHSDEYDIDECFEILDEKNYQIDWFIEKLKEKGITITYEGEEW